MSHQFSTELFGEVIKPIQSIQSQLLSNSNDMHCSFRVSDFERCASMGWKQKEDSTTISTSYSSSIKIKSLAKTNKQFKSQKSPHQSINGRNLLSITSAHQFYCNCSQQNGKMQECGVCGGTGEVNGKDNMVKFMEYIMEFKLGIKNSYVASSFSHSPTLNAHQNRPNPELSSPIERQQVLNEEPVDQFPRRMRKTSRDQGTGEDSKYFTQYEMQVFEMHEACSLLIGFDGFKFQQNNSQNRKQFGIANQSGEISNSSFLKSITLARAHSIAIDNETQIRQEGFQYKNYPINMQLGQSVCFEESYVEIQKYSKKCVSIPIQHHIPTSLLKPHGKLLESQIFQKNMISLQELEEKMRLERMSHQGYVCDHCDMEPIIGSRYHCQHEDCDDDYDLCAKCYVEIGHPHPLEECRLEKGQGLKQIISKVGRMFGKIGSRRLSTGSLRGNKMQRTSFQANGSDLESERRKFGIHKSMSLGDWI